MKRLKYHWSAQPISMLLSVLMLLPALVMWAFSAQPTNAQTATNPTTWAVLDFANRSAYGGNEVGRQASDSLVVELGKSNQYDISRRQDIKKSVDTLGLTAPLDTVGIQKLGRDLGVTGVVTGDVVGVAFSNNPRVATVTIAVKVIDPRSGLVVNGALAKGQSTPRAVPTTDDDSLVNQAIDNASFNAVRLIAANRLPIATVIGNQENVILLNKGTRDGLYDGLNMLVTRNNEVVGTLKVIGASADQSNAVSTNESLGIRPQDRAQALYELPRYTVASNGDIITGAVTNPLQPNVHSHNSGMNGIGGVILAVAVAFLLLRLAHGGAGSGDTANAHLGAATAVFGRVTDPVDGGLGVGGVPPFDVATGTFPVQNYVPVSVHVSATTGNIPASEFLEYHIFRADFTGQNIIIGSTSGSTNGTTTGTSTGTTTGTTTGTGTSSTTGTTVGTITGIFNVGVIPVFAVRTIGRLDFYDDGSPKTFAYSTVQSGSQLASTISLVDIASGIPVSLVGQRFNYTLEGLWEDVEPILVATSGTTNIGTTNSGTSSSGGTTSGSTNSGSTNSGSTNSGSTNSGSTTSSTTTGLTGLFDHLTSRAQTNYVTYIEPPLVDATSFTGTGPTNANFNIPCTRGANDYVLQISTDPLFKNKKTYGPTNAPQPGSASQTNPRQGAPLNFFTNKDLRRDFPNQTALFARVGARDQANGSDNRTNPYVFSDPITVPTFLLQ